MCTIRSNLNKIKYKYKIHNKQQIMYLLMHTHTHTQTNKYCAYITQTHAHLCTKCLVSSLRLVYD